MYTVEFEKDASIVTTLDDSDKFEDVEMVLVDDGTIYLRQFDDSLKQFQMLYMSYQQFLDLVAAHQSPEGAYRLELNL